MLSKLLLDTVAATQTMATPLTPRAAYFSVLLLFLVHVIGFSDAAFGSKKREQEEAALRAEADRLSKLVVVLGHEIDKGLFFVCSSLLVLGVSLAAIGRIRVIGTKSRIGNRPGADDTVDVVLVGCGLPKKGMGWYHLTQLLEMPNVNVRGVVEPFFMNENLCKNPPSSWMKLVESLSNSGVEVSASVRDLSNFNSKKQTMCLIAGRTPDNPKLFKQCIVKGATIIYLEKPGAPTVTELEEMKVLADFHKVKVYLGYNKNVTPYVQKAISLSKYTPDTQVLFCHNNSYSQKDLPECFTRNSEGMLKNMAIHELALLVSFFGITVDTLKEFRINKSSRCSEKLSVLKTGSSPSNPEYITDFSRVKFRVTSKDGVVATVVADRCGGNVSYASVIDSQGEEVKRFEFPDAKMMARIDGLVKQDPEMMPYFHIQSDDYLELKKRVVRSALERKDAEGVATIGVGIEALKLAEYGTNKLTKAL